METRPRASDIGSHLRSGQCLLKSAAKRSVLQLWRSNLTSSSSYGVNPSGDQLFQKLEPISVSADGVVRIWVHPEEVLTLTTLTTGGSITIESPPKAPFPLPYTQSFDDERIGVPARFWYDQMGAWEIQDSPYGDVATRGKVMRQVVPVFPQCWGYLCESPSTSLGPSSFKGNITVSLDVRLEGHGAISLNPMGLNHAPLRIDSQGKWSLGQRRSGNVNFDPDVWHTVTFRMWADGSQDAFVDGKEVMPKVALLSLRGQKQHTTEQCDGDTFPISTKGRKQLGLKKEQATTYELCRQACCRDENLCDVFQFDGTTCEIGRLAGGYDKDKTHIWSGGSRWEAEGWHLKVRLSRYMYASLDNFRIFTTS